MGLKEYLKYSREDHLKVETTNQTTISAKRKNFLSVNIHSYNIQRCETQPSLNAWQGKAEERRYREQPWDHYYSKKITMIKFHCHQSKIPYAILEGQRQSQSQIQSLY